MTNSAYQDYLNSAMVARAEAAEAEVARLNQRVDALDAEAEALGLDADRLREALDNLGNEGATLSDFPEALAALDALVAASGCSVGREQRMSAAQAARLIWIHGGRSIDPRTSAYFAGKISGGSTP